MDTDPDDANGRSSAKAAVPDGAIRALEALFQTSGRSRDEQNQALRDVARFAEDNDYSEILDKAREFAVKSLRYDPFEVDQQIFLETTAEEPASLAEQAWQDEDWKRAAEDYRRNTGGLGRHQPNGKAWSNFYKQPPGAAAVALQPKPNALQAVLRLDDWLKRDLEPPTLVMGEWLSTTSRVMLYAPTGLGKSMFGIGLGMSSAAGNGFLHWRGHGPCRVLYIDGEMSRPLLKERLAGEVDRLGYLPSCFYALSHEDVTDFAPLNTEEGQKTVDGIIEKIGGIDLLLLDNIMSLIGGDMKEEEGWRQTIPWQHSLTKRRIGQFWFHHTGHDKSKGYGTKTKEWQLDTVLKMEKVDRDDTDVSFTLHFQKARLRTPQTRQDFRDVAIALVDNRWELSEEDGTKNRRSNPTDTGKKYLDALTNCTATFVSGKARVSMADWEREAIKLCLIDRNDSPNNKRAKMSKYRAELVSKGWVACDDNLAWRV